MVLCFLCSILFNSFIFYWIILPLAIVFGIKYRIKSSRGRPDLNNEIDISGKTVIITGASDGIGKVAAQELAIRGAKVILACRNLGKAKVGIEDIRKVTGNGDLIAMHLDLSSLSSVRKFASEFISQHGGPSKSGLSILINNAGVQNLVGVKNVTVDGFEECFGVNHLAHFLLTNLLLPELERAAEKHPSVAARIVNVSSETHVWGQLNFNDLMFEKTPLQDFKFLPKLYCNSKLANNLFTVELAKRLREKKVNVNTYAACPGIVHTNLRQQEEKSGSPPPALVRRIMFPIMDFFAGKDVNEGTETTIYCSLSKYLEHHSGEVYSNCQFWDYSTRPKLSEKDATQLWEMSEKLVKL